MAWGMERRIALNYIQAGKPTQNAYAESFNGKFRDECLNQELCYTVAEAQVIYAKWLRHFNTERPHSSLKYMTPGEFRAKWEYEHLGALPPNPWDLAHGGHPVTKSRPSRSPAHPSWPPATALRSLPSVALSSAQAMETKRTEG